MCRQLSPLIGLLDKVKAPTADVLPLRLIHKGRRGEQSSNAISTGDVSTR